MSPVGASPASITVSDNVGMGTNIVPATYSSAVTWSLNGPDAQTTVAMVAPVDTDMRLKE
jgi:hypothetical protein